MTLRISKTLGVFAVSILPVLAAPAAGQSLNGSADGSYDVAEASYTRVLSTLESTGYRVIEMKSTFLGRVKILAKNRVHLREIVVSRSTGEVKSDVILAVFETDKDASVLQSSKNATVSAGSSTGASASVGGVSAGVSAGTGGVGASAGGIGVSVGEDGVSVGGLGIGD